MTERPSSGGVGEASSRIMKKEYIKPEMEEMLVECQQMLSASTFGPESGDNYGGDEAGAPNKRRGSWGNLWDKN